MPARALSRARARQALLAVIALLALMVSGCHARISADIDVSPNGSGRIHFVVQVDKAADDTIRSLTGQTYAEAASLSDVADAGFEVARHNAESGSSIEIAREFGNPKELIDDLSALGASEPAVITDVAFSIKSSALRDEFDFGSTVDLSVTGLVPPLESLMGHDAFVALKHKFDFDPARDVAMSVALRLPGTIDSTNADSVSGSQASWDIAPGTKRHISARSKYWLWQRMAAGGAGVLLVGVLAAVLASDAIRRRRRRRKNSPTEPPALGHEGSGAGAGDA